MKKQAFNPYLPSWEYIPDGEPHVFDGRIYVFGSHDIFNGWVFCLGDYICYSAPVDDLSDWRYEGVIYPKTADPLNKDGKMCLYAPDVTVGPDGRYYLYYALDKVSVISVAVSDTPAGKYEFYGYVHYKDGTRLGERKGDEPQFDPGVITEGSKTYLYTGFCGRGDKSRHGSMCTTLGSDMLTIEEEPVFVVPGIEYAKGTSFEGHSFFEASSIRKIGDVYYFIYSCESMRELCYATSKNPRKDFVYGGVLVSNEGGNNHGSIVKIKDSWYVFYHRQTNGNWYSRQGCAEKIEILPDGSIPQVEMTSCGLNGAPLKGKGEYSAHIACSLYNRKENNFFTPGSYPRLTQDGKDGDEIEGHIENIRGGDTIGFKYFDFKDTKKITIITRGHCSGTFEVKTALDAPALAKIKVEFTNNWEKFSSPVDLSCGKAPLYLAYCGNDVAMLKGIILE